MTKKNTPEQETEPDESTIRLVNAMISPKAGLKSPPLKLLSSSSTSASKIAPARSPWPQRPSPLQIVENKIIEMREEKLRSAERVKQAEKREAEAARRQAILKAEMEQQQRRYADVPEDRLREDESDLESSEEDERNVRTIQPQPGKQVKRRRDELSETDKLTLEMFKAASPENQFKILTGRIAYKARTTTTTADEVEKEEKEYCEGKLIKMRIKRETQTWASKTNNPMTFSELANARRHDEDGLIIMTAEGFIHLDQEDAPKKANTENINIGRVAGQMCSRSKILDPDHHSSVAEIPTHSRVNAALRSYLDVREFLTKQQTVTIMTIAETDKPIDEPELTMASATNKFLQCVDNAYTEAMAGYARGKHPKQISIEAAIIFFVIRRWNRAWLSIDSRGKRGVAMKLTENMREDWQKIYDDLLSPKVHQARQAIIFQNAMIICEIRCGRCHMIGSCDLFCLGKCNHINNRPLHEGKGATDLKTKGKNPYLVFCEDQGEIRMPLRMERVGGY